MDEHRNPLSPTDKEIQEMAIPTPEPKDIVKKLKPTARDLLGVGIGLALSQVPVVGPFLQETGPVLAELLVGWLSSVF